MDKQDNYSYEEVLELTKQGKEIWRRVIIDDITFDYEVSNLGRIKSLKWRGCGKEIGYGSLNKNSGYMRKILYYTDEKGNKKHKAYLIHRLVAIMFIPNSENKPQVDHIDTNRNNNRVDNLRWATQQENMDNDKTKENLLKAIKRPVIVLDRNGRVISSGLGVEETAELIGVSRDTLTSLLKSNHLYRAKIYSGGSDIGLLRSLNGARAFYIDEYNEKEVIREMMEDKTDYSYCQGDVVCVFTNDKVTKPMTGRKLARELGISRTLVCKLKDSKKPYKVPVKRYRGSKEHLEHLQTLEGIRIMYYEDYLKERND